MQRIREALRRLDAEASRARRTWPHTREAFFDALANDFNTPAALAALFEWVREANRRGGGRRRRRSARDARRARARALAPLEAVARVRASDPRRRRCSSAREQARRRATSRPPIACASRLRARGWEIRDGPDGPGADPRARAVILYGRNPVREALRGRRADSVGEVWATAAPRASRGSRARRSHGRRARRSSAAAARTAHQGVCARARARTPTRAPRSCCAGESPLLVALDQVQDPQNLGSICRTAECAGAAGVVIPERRAAEVTPAVCKASAGAVEHLRVARVRNLADFLAEARDGRLLVLRRERRARTREWPRARCAYDAPDYSGSGRGAGAGQRGQRPAPARGAGRATS